MRLTWLRRTPSLRKRLIHTLLIRLALGLTIAAIGTFYAVNHVLSDDKDRQLAATATIVDQWVGHYPAGSYPSVGDSTNNSEWAVLASAGVLPAFMQIRDPHNHVVVQVGSGPPIAPSLDIGPYGSGTLHDGAITYTADIRGNSGAALSYRVRMSRLLGGRGFLVLASSDQDVRETMSALGKIEGAACLLAFGLVGFMANRKIKRDMTPFERMGEHIVAIGAGQLDQRVEPADQRTEVGRVGAALNTMLARLERAFREQRATEERLRRFVADASHELRTPLASIRGYAELFRRGAASRPEDLALAMRRIESESARMGVLVDELLLLARLDSGRPLERGRVDLAALARDAARDSQAAGAQWPVDVTVHCDGPDGASQRIEISGDADRLRQVLANLLANVRAHTPAGTPARVSVRRDGADAVLEVADQGPGLPPDQQAKVFERFYRVDASRKRDDGAGGSGLGLSIVASVAAAHGGGASVRSAEGRGAVFCVRLPVDGVGANGNTPVRTLTEASQDSHSASPVPRDCLSFGTPRRDKALSHRTRRESDGMERISRLVVAHRRLVGLLWLVALVAGGAASSTLANRLDNTFSMPGQPGYVANTSIAAEYGNGGGLSPLVPVVRVPAADTAKDPRVAAAFASLSQIPGIRVADYSNSGNSGFIGSDGRTTFALVFTGGSGMAAQQAQDAIAGKIQSALTATLPAGSELRVTGLGPLQTTAGSGKGVSVMSEVLLGGLGALAVLLFVFASFLAFAPMLVAAVSVLTSYLAILGVTEFTSVSGIVQYLVGLIGLGVAIDYSLLLVTRWREELAHGYDNETAIHRAMATAGRAVVFSGVTVALGLLSLVILPVPFLRSIGYGGMIIPLVSVVVTLTLVPALLAGVGRRMDWPKIRHEDKASRGWTAWANLVVRRRWIAAIGALVMLGALAFSVTGMKIGSPSSDALSQSGPAHEGVVLLRNAGIPTGALTPIEVLVAQPAGAPQAVGAVKSVSGVEFSAAPTGPQWQRPGSSLVEVIPVAEGTSSVGEGTTRAVRSAASAVPGALVGGVGAVEVDMIHAVYGTFPLMLAALGVLTFVLLARAFRSLLLPLKAVILNLLSLAAVYGAIVLIWQKGYGSNPIWGIPATGAVTAWIPLMVFAFLYGLSMDYEVFILARMREEYDETRSTTQAVVTGIGRTGRLVTSAALILFLAMAALGSAPGTDVKIFATALGTGILLDATVVRALLVPALISLFGRWNWWMPVWAARILRVEPSPAWRENVTPLPLSAAEPENAKVG